MGRETLTTPVGELPGGLEKEQATVGIERIDPPAQGLARQSGVVASGIGAEERETEAVLPLERSMTGTGVATRLAEQAHDVTLEVHARDRAAVGESDACTGR